MLVSPPSAQCLMWCPSMKCVLVQPGKRQPWSLARSARLIDGGIERDFRPMDKGSPVSSSLSSMRVQSQAIRRAVSAAMWGAFSMWDRYGSWGIGGVPAGTFGSSGRGSGPAPTVWACFNVPAGTFGSGGRGSGPAPTGWACFDVPAGTLVGGDSFRVSGDTWTTTW